MKKIIKAISSITVLFAFTASFISCYSANNETQSEKKKGRTVVLFKDGSTITDEDIKKDMENLPDQISSKMSLKEIKSLLAWQAAYKKVISAVAKKSGAADEADVRKLIKKRKLTAAGFLLSDAEAKKLMTRDALKKHYDEMWDKNFKGKKEFSLVAITTRDKNIADRIKSSVKDEAALRRILEPNATTTKSVDMDSRSQTMFPPEIVEAVLKQGEGSIVGPFELKGSFMLFYVKKISDATKKEFTDEIAESYEKAALKDFLVNYMKTLYAKYKVKIFDVNKKEVDPFEITKKGDNSKKKDQTDKLTKLQDGDILAVVGDDKVTAKELKEFFKVKSVLDEAFISMAQQFGLRLEEVIVYAVKLLVDDLVLAKEVTLLKYDSNPDIVPKLQDIEGMEIQHAYYKKTVKVTPVELRKTFDKFIKSIPEEDKNDNEISVKLVFFQTQEDAAQALRSIISGDMKFGELFKEKSSGNEKTAVDIGYVKKRGTPPELWSLLKRGASGACCKDIVEIDGSQFGMKGGNYAIIYIADRRPITLPSLSNEGDKKYFQRLAERGAAVEIAKQHLLEKVKTIDGLSLDSLVKSNPTYVDGMLSALTGYSG